MTEAATHHAYALWVFLYIAAALLALALWRRSVNPQANRVLAI